VTGQLGLAVGIAALVAEWQTAKVAGHARARWRPLPRQSERLAHRLRNPLALALAPDRSLLVGDWGSGIIYRITRRGS
jgi:hypothetical protein